MITQDAGDLVHGESRGPSEVQRPTVVRAIAGEDRNGNLSNVGLRHHRHPPVARWSANVPIGAEEVRREIGIDVVAQDRMGNADRAQMLLGRPVVAGQREGCRCGGAEEGHVHDPLYASRDGRVNKGEVLLDAVRQSRQRRP